MTNQVIHGNCMDVLPTLADKSVFSVITDPPYGIKLDTWDVPVDIPLFTEHAARLSTGFYCFFGQMPTMVDWVCAAREFMQYREHISWVKRNCMVQPGLLRGHEGILVFKHNRANFYKTIGKYEDVKVPGLMFDVITIEGIRSHISALYSAIKNGGNMPQSSMSVKCQPVYTREWYIEKAKQGVKQLRHPADGKSNFTNVWSFLPPTKVQYGKNAIKHQHPTQKPLELMKRLVELTTPPGGIVLDPFAGSGTTAIACLETGRQYICIEQSDEYYQMILNRIADWKEEKAQATQQLELLE